jgi:hypothetical protein
MHIFWIAALLLAMIDLPDFGTSLSRIAGSAEKIAGIPPGQGVAVPMPDTAAESGEKSSAPETHTHASAPHHGDGAATLARPEAAPARTKGLTHA